MSLQEQCAPFGKSSLSDFQRAQQAYNGFQWKKLDSYNGYQFNDKLIRQEYPMTTEDAFYMLHNTELPTWQSKPRTNLFYNAFMTLYLVPGARARIKAGYDGAGTVGFYQGKSNDDAGKVIFRTQNQNDLDVDNIMLAEAIEVYPYSREERLQQAVEDFIGMAEGAFALEWDDCNLLAALIDYGV